MARTPSRRGLLPVDLVLLAFLFSSRATAELFYTAISHTMYDGLINKAPTVCPVSQDGYTSNTFPWTHYPTCVNVVLPSKEEEGLGVHETFCTYTNTNYNNGRGISFVVTPEVAASITFESFGMAVGGQEGQIGEEMGTWEVKDTNDRGKGLFAKKDIAAVIAGESLIVKTPVLFVARSLLKTLSTTRRELVLSRALEQLPEKISKTLKNLAKSWDGSEAFDVIKTNGLEVKWPWVDDIPQLLAVTPEVARINHACRPNAMWRFNDYTLAFDVVALKDIKPDGFERRAFRRRTRSIVENLNFTCLCPLCTSSENAIMESNDRLSEIKALESVLPTDPADSPQLLGLLPNLIMTLEEEDLHTETAMYEEILAYTWSSFGWEDRAKYWAGRARKHWAVVAGKDSWESRRCGDLEDNVKGHASWMTWEGDPWEDVGKGHPWDEKLNGHDHDHEHDHAGSEDLRSMDQRVERDQFRGHT
ncbi:hypothetical protein EK21DRAFT_102934 [Setomelanomma holmii]|uniref:SET domain-containing protein n=1 Tax=Setomelanomma holmii TaxID=210430 RepID=A0A9P4H3E5_9PLEO|nr:hypothetical protein EK21DRAFT_102934 [Setomelanomma holmii]